MDVLAIDPGPVESAYLIMSGGEIEQFSKVPNQQLIEILGSSRWMIDDVCVIEMIASYGMPVGREVFETCVWIGRFMEAFGPDHCDRLTRIEIKSHMCHSAKAKDGNIRQALIDRLGPPGTKRAPGGTYGVSGDVWSALAVAVTWTDKHASAPAIT